MSAFKDALLASRMQELTLTYGQDSGAYGSGSFPFTFQMTPKHVPLFPPATPDPGYIIWGSS